MRHAGDFVFRHTNRNEVGDPAILIAHADRGIARASLVTGNPCDSLQEGIERDVLNQLQTGLMEGREALLKLFGG